MNILENTYQNNIKNIIELNNLLKNNYKKNICKLEKKCYI